MTVQLNYTIVAARDRDEAAEFLADSLGLAPRTTYGPFAVVGVSGEAAGRDAHAALRGACAEGAAC